MSLAPRITGIFKGQWKVTVSVELGVREQLENYGVDTKGIEAIIWSHWHWDHTGDPSTFEKSTKLIIGPGFKKAFTPGYPSNPEAPILESDYEGRELKEVDFDQKLKIGSFDALDYFGDGSFYLLDSAGHAIEHLCGLARVTTSPDSFIFMGGDTCHHGGEFRPSQYIHIPSSLLPNPFNFKSQIPCPGAIFEELYRDKDPQKPFYGIARLGDRKGVAHDVDEAERTIGKVIEVDANTEVLVVMAHDETLLDVVDFFPKEAGNFLEKGWVEEGKWGFLKDFREDVGYSEK